MVTPYLFVYGTLRPGEPRWSLLVPLLTSSGAWTGPVTIPGRLYGTPFGWPAAVFEQGERAVVPGVVVKLPDPIGALVILDDIEGQRLDYSAGGSSGRTVTTSGPTNGLMPFRPTSYPSAHGLLGCRNDDAGACALCSVLPNAARDRRRTVSRHLLVGSRRHALDVGRRQADVRIVDGGRVGEQLDVVAFS